MRCVKQIRRVVFIAILTTITISIVKGQDAVFSHLGVESGLSQSTVTSIYEDEFKQMWIGTRDGLNRYDGNGIEKFRHIVGDTLGLMGNDIRYITGNGRGALYFRCVLDLVKYDLKLEKISIIKTDGVSAIHYGKSGLWLAEKGRISILNEETNVVEPRFNISNSITVSSMLELSNGNLCIGTSAGLYIADKNYKLQLTLPLVNVTTVYEDSSHNFWIGTIEDGLYRFDRRGVWVNYRHRKGDKSSISDNYIRAVCQDNLGHYWIGTQKGVSCLDLGQGKFDNYEQSVDNPHGLSSTSVTSIYKDHQGSIWIGTYFGGLNLINPKYTISRFFRKYSTQNGLSGMIVSDIVCQKNGVMWIGTEDGGLNEYNSKNGLFSSFQDASMPTNIKSILLDSTRNCLWIGAHISGFYKFDIATHTAKRINIGTTIRTNNYVRAIVSRGNNLFLGTQSSVVVLDLNTYRATPLIDTNRYPELNNRQIWDMALDCDDNLWFSTSTSVYKYSFNDEKLKEYKHNPKDSKSISACYLNTFFQTKEGKLYIGSAGSGVNVYDRLTDTFSHITTHNSNLIDDYILSINQSPTGYILIATHKGLSRFDAENNLFTNYTNREFFHFASMNERGIHIGVNNEILISSINGLVVVNENDLNIEPTSFNINISRLFVNNTQIRPGDNTHILDESILYCREIKLKSRYSAFSVEYAISNYLMSISPKIEYRLEGFDHNWIVAQRNIITYTNLSPGTYTLRIRAVDDGSFTKVPEIKLSIKILPPLYKSTIAYLLYFIIIFILIYIVFRYYSTHLRLKSSLALAKVEKEHIEEINQIKLCFFTNISHEFRTPLTLIKAQIEQLIESGEVPHNIYSRMLLMLKNAEKMNYLFSELLDFRKQEQGFMKLNVSRFDVVELLDEVFLIFREYARTKDVGFTIEVSVKQIFIWADKAQIEKVFYNILSNAFKFTPSKQNVSITVAVEQNNVIIEFADSGVGILEKDIDHIFEHFYQGNNQSATNGQPGTGIGLSLCRSIIETHNGTINARHNAPCGTIIKVSLSLDNKLKETNCGNVPDSTITTVNSEPSSEIEISTNNGNLDRSILIVEDNADLRGTLTQLFAPIYMVYQACDGEQGYFKAVELQPDIVLADVMMPKMSGTEMCRKIKSHIETSHIPVVLLTARVAPEMMLEGLLTGADDYIAKPFNSKNLIARCNNIINTRRVLQERFSKSQNSDSIVLATNSADNQFICNAIKIVEQNITNDKFDINEFADKMNLGRTTLFTKIKGVTGQTPNEFILNIRLKMAIKYLCEDTSLSAAEISTIVGFSDPPYFMRCFKKVYGITPIQYRKNMTSR